VQPTTLEIIATCLFAVAVLHTFLVKRFEVLAHRHEEGSVARNFFELLGEVEVVFGFWALGLVICSEVMEGDAYVIDWLNGRHAQYRVDFTEPLFVFAIMSIAATRPVLDIATALIERASKLIPLSPTAAFFPATLILGPLLGGFITGPAAMTVTALILRRRYFARGMSTKFMYATVGVLFVNVSVGGSLTNFAAPPVLMVARTWDWSSPFMLGHFGWKAAVAVIINAVLLTWYFRSEFEEIGKHPIEGEQGRSPRWLRVVHLVFMGGVVANSHEVTIFMGIFLFFLGVVDVTQEHQERLRLRQSLLVAFFLGGLVVLGSYQQWWLRPLLGQMEAGVLFPATASLTAVTDNAALTYLGSLVPDLGDADKYALVAGALAGGGLTVIANAPNPAGYGILRWSFGEDGISPLGLLVGALIPTLVALAAFWFLPSIG
jgi:hypothetical protein